MNAVSTLPRPDVSVSPLFDTAAAAKFLGVATKSLEVWRWQGRGPRFIKIGRSVRYRLSDLEAYLDERTCENTGAFGNAGERAATA